MISTVLLVGASVAKCAEPIQSAGLPLQPLDVGKGGKKKRWTDGEAALKNKEKREKNYKNLGT